MKFPRIFTKIDKQHALELRSRHPELADNDIITKVVTKIQTEIADGEKRALAAKLTKNEPVKKLQTTKKTKLRRVYLRRLPGSFESAQR
jgi:hypothetical protein